MPGPRYHVRRKDGRPIRFYSEHIARIERVTFKSRQQAERWLRLHGQLSDPEGVARGDYWIEEENCD